MNTGLNEEYSIFVIQNPAVTAILKNTRNDGIRYIYETNDATLQVLERKFGIGVKKIKYYREQQYVSNLDNTY